MRLEIRNLCKQYYIKNHTPVKALDNVSLLFPETGLVFILGKSGSGKSTLLNVLGGLDKADSGEIIINNKSSKDFTGSEMDSYRNTYLGFIFQEYNILNDFTVGENIGLALGLQHKKYTQADIDEILNEVGLQGLANRKPNELSGGQKQRVAIARALVKDPKIIFADEPTGALDSDTGAAVFETLKNLSKTRLVICVSHDRDFAEHFGDRVIEIKDGVVISDISKEYKESTLASEGVSFVGNNILRIEKGHKLTQKDLEIINSAIERSENPSFVSFDNHVNEAIKEVGKITEEGNIQVFEKTDNSKVKAGNGTFEVVKSKFGMKSAFKMGARSLKVKPFRLIMTVLLSVVSFTTFGISATCSNINVKKIISNTFVDNETKILPIYSSDWIPSYYENNGYYPTGSEIDVFKEKNFKKFDTYYYANIQCSYLSMYSELSESNFYNPYYCDSSAFSIEYNDNLMNKMGYSLAYGEWPKADDEIVITDWAYRGFEDFGFDNDEVTISAKDVTPENIIGQNITLRCDTNIRYSSPRKVLKISGIAKTKTIEYLDKNYPEYRNKTNINNINGTMNTTDIINGMLSSSNIESFNGGYIVCSKGAFNDLTLDKSDVWHKPVNRYKGLIVTFNNVSECGEIIDVINNLNPKDSEGYRKRNVQSDNELFSMIYEFESATSSMGVVFRYIGTGFLAFSMLLFYSFISISINNKRREIGILRAVGARGIDVFKIFYSEALIITVFNVLFSVLFTFLGCMAINNGFQSSIRMAIKMLNVGFGEVSLIVIIALISSFVSAFLPVFKIARQKPVDAIRGK